MQVFAPVVAVWLAVVYVLCLPGPLVTWHWSHVCRLQLLVLIVVTEFTGVVELWQLRQYGVVQPAFVVCEVLRPELCQLVQTLPPPMSYVVPSTLVVIEIAVCETSLPSMVPWVVAV